MIVGGLAASDVAPGAYGVYTAAKTSIDRKVRTEEDGKSRIEESWSFTGEPGAAIEVQVRYERGTVSKVKGDSHVVSGAKPEFFRIYRVEQGVDVARSTATGSDRVSQIAVKISGQQFGSVFDGSEKLISVISLPTYSRQLFLPGSS